MSNESPQPAKRPYRKRRRAEHEEGTRLRITEAAVELHGSIGPARTTISAVADRAGVQRATVYRHFHDEAALFAACSSHWMAQHPLPDPAAWASTEDPDARVRSALRQVYGWYGEGADMLGNVIRDVELVPAMRPPVETFRAALHAVSEAVVRGRPERGIRRRRVRAAVRHALAFETWQGLVRAQELSEAEAIDLMEAFVTAAAGHRGTRDRT